ncbi:hypothetical protein [Alienimonas chondri]|uniref:Uncharacterized protein n=1 Tax=Alienimonas chondri TaxID=2681879 RepID=A0ABX1V931_9PLAN|nr:hypothetical protein [Alienimonas chondri]NNJ24599.1 hypothetical protein [Alienimonas chondri]
MKHGLAAAAPLCLVALFGAGCQEKPPPRILSVAAESTTPLRERDVDEFLWLASMLSEEELEVLAEARPTLSDWPSESTRTVSVLTANERRAIEEGLRGSSLAETVAARPDGPRLLEELGWSAERFASVGAALGFAATANDLLDERELRRLQDEAQRQLVRLEADHRVFHQLSEADTAAIRRRAAWIPRAALLDAILGSSPENRRLALHRGNDLAAVLPDGFDRTALDRLLSDRERSAIPFHEPKAERDDALLRWDGAAIVSKPLGR